MVTIRNIYILNNLATCNLVAEAHEANQWNCRCAYQIDVFKQVEEKDGKSNLNSVRSSN